MAQNWHKNLPHTDHKNDVTELQCVGVLTWKVPDCEELSGSNLEVCLTVKNWCELLTGDDGVAPAKSINV